MYIRCSAKRFNVLYDNLLYAIQTRINLYFCTGCKIQNAINPLE